VTPIAITDRKLKAAVLDAIRETGCPVKTIATELHMSSSHLLRVLGPDLADIRLERAEQLDRALEPARRIRAEQLARQVKAERAVIAELRNGSANGNGHPTA
jgi:AraC-like DNA-binding protein